MFGVDFGRDHYFNEISLHVDIELAFPLMG